MGYEVHITRGNDSSANAGARIPEAEWRDYVTSDAELEMTGAAEITTPRGDRIRIIDPLITAWRGHSSGFNVWFSYHDGKVSVKNPDEECIAKMKLIAKELGATLQGDDGEFYD